MALKSLAKQYAAIYKLKNTYGETIPNHGKNLLHKMLLEGRIELKNIPKSPYDCPKK